MNTCRSIRNTINLPAGSIQIDSENSTGTFNFPSLKKLKITDAEKNVITMKTAWSDKGKTECLKNYTLQTCIHEPCAKPFVQAARYVLTEEEKPSAPKIGYQMKPASQFIAVEDDGKGSLRLLFVPENNSDDKTLNIIINGAIVANTTSGSIKLEHTGNLIVLKLTNNKSTFSLDIALTGLAEGEDVTINMQNDKQAKANEIMLRTRLIAKKPTQNK